MGVWYIAYNLELTKKCYLLKKCYLWSWICTDWTVKPFCSRGSKI